MELSEARGIKTSQWVSNEILRADDLNIISQSQYQNLCDRAILDAGALLTSGNSVVLSGLVLAPVTGLQCVLSTGMAVSSEGTYINSDSWGFSADSNKGFIVVVPEDQALTFDSADPTNPRIDIVEIRPTQTAYNSESRQYKDPITDVITSALTMTRLEYSYEVQIVKGTAAASPLPQTKTAGWIKLAEVFVEAALTTLQDSNILTYKKTNEWVRNIGGTIDNNPSLKLEADLTVYIYLSDSEEIRETKINDVPKNLNGYTLTFLYETGVYVYENISLLIQGFYNGTVELDAASTTTFQFSYSSKVKFLDCSAFIYSKPYIRYEAVVAGTSEQYEALLTIQHCTDILFEGNLYNTDVAYSGFIPFISLSYSTVNFLRSTSYIDIGSSASCDFIFQIDRCHINAFPQISGSITFDYYVHFDNVVVEDSDNIITGITDTITATSQKYTLLDQIQPNIDTATNDLSDTVSSYLMSLVYTTEKKIVAYDAQADDFFGLSVSISGDYAIVGAYFEDTGGSNAGAAYIFHRTGTNTWDSGTKIVASDAQADDYFGYSVAISGDYAVVGAYQEDAGGFSAGAAYIFHRTGTNTWDSGVKIVAPDIQASDRFGFSVSISGDYAVVGAYFEDTGGSNAGAAYIFHRTGTNTWDSGTKIVASDAQADDYFGYSVAISGDYAIVGAKDETTGGTDSGAAYIFHRTGTNTWDSGVKIVSPDAAVDEFFGVSVSISGDYAVVGANEDDAGGSDAGAAYIFHRTGLNTWDAGVKIVASDAQASDRFGFSVSISGDYAVVGASDEDAGGVSAGAAYIFHRTGLNTWDAGVKIVASDIEIGDRFGYSVSISGDYAVVGTPFEDTGGSNAGAAYLYQIPMF